MSLEKSQPLKLLYLNFNLFPFLLNCKWLLDTFSFCLEQVLTVLLPRLQIQWLQSLATRVNVKKLVFPISSIQSPPYLSHVLNSKPSLWMNEWCQETKHWSYKCKKQDWESILSTYSSSSSCLRRYILVFKKITFKEEGDRVLLCSSPDQARTLYVAQAGLALAVTLLPQPFSGGITMHELPMLVWTSYLGYWYLYKCIMYLKIYNHHCFIINLFFSISPKIKKAYGKPEI